MKKLIEIQKKLKAPKGQFNSFGNYNYRSCEDILEAVKPLCEEQGLLLTLTDVIESIGGKNYLKATATVSDGTTAVSVSAYAREAETKKGMDDAQITGSCSSYARKYALNGLFLIDDTKDADTDEVTHKTQAHKPLVAALANFNASKADKQAPASDAREMKSKYKSLCKGCNGDIAIGEDIIYSKQNGVFHFDCYQGYMHEEGK